jgi:hypothetical protein
MDRIRGRKEELMGYKITVETVDSKGHERAYTFVRDHSKNPADPVEDALATLEQAVRTYDAPKPFRDVPHTLVQHLINYT